MSVKEVTSESNFKTFEHQEFKLNLRSSKVCVTVLYQPPPSAANGYTYNSFMDEFSDYLASFSSSSNSVLIMGDFNIHFDDSNNHQTQAFLALLSSVNLQQLVKTSTHIKGHCLDLIIVREDDQRWANICQKSMYFR